MTDSAQPGTRGRLPRWMVILCVLMGIAVVGVVIGVPYYREQRAIGYIESVGGSIEYEPGGTCLPGHAGEHLMQVFDRVSAVGLCETSVSDAGLAHLRGLTILESLNLSETAISDAGLSHLRGLASLESLSLDRNEITDAGLAHLRDLSNIKSLGLDGTKITDAGLIPLSGLRSLKWLSVTGTGVSASGVATLRRALPGCTILWKGGSPIVWKWTPPELPPPSIPYP